MELSENVGDTMLYQHWLSQLQVLFPWNSHSPARTSLINKCFKMDYVDAINQTQRISTQKQQKNGLINRN